MTQINIEEFPMHMITAGLTAGVVEAFMSNEAEFNKLCQQHRVSVVSNPKTLN